MKTYKEIKDLHLSGEYMTLTIDGEDKKFRIKGCIPHT